MGAAAPPVDAPLVLIGRAGRRRVVLAVDAAAARAGLRPGLPAAMAQALVPGVAVHPADPAADAEALDRLALWALQRYAPLAAADPPDGLIIDMSGAAHLRGGEGAALADMIGRLAACRIAARAALADSRGAAHALARYGGRPALVVAPGQSAAALLALPVAALRLPEEMVEGLRGLGFAHIGELAASPRAPLVLRFGPDLGRRLDQALGRRDEPIDPVRPPDGIEVRRAFAEPITAAEALARQTGILVADLCARLAAAGLGARRLDLLFHRVDNRIQSIRIGTVRPVRDARRLTRLLCDRLETIDPDFGIEIMSLSVALAEPLGPRQMVSALAAEPEADLSGLIDRLANRIGAARLYRLAPVASDVPERSLRRIAPLAPPTRETWPGHWPRPSRLLARPEPIATVALLPDHPPARFTWRGVSRRVARADGPERIFGEWWRRDAELCAVRDYFRIEDEAGERFWIYRAGDGEDAATGSQRWFLHGIFG